MTPRFCLNNWKDGVAILLRGSAFIQNILDKCPSIFLEKSRSVGPQWNHRRP